MKHTVYEETADGNVISHVFKNPYEAHVHIKKLIRSGQKEVYELLKDVLFCNYNINTSGTLEYVAVDELPERIRLHLLLGAIQ